MKVLIIEDERPAAQKLVRLLTEMEQNIDISAITESVETSVNWLREHPLPDLIFMDIQLEDGICFEIFETINLTIPVIFTTAFDEYTLKAFKVNSVDYLLKPINGDELKVALEKYKSIHSSKVNMDRIESLLKHAQVKSKERFLIKVGEHYKSIPVNEINCFYIRERCNFILVNSGRSYALDYSLDKIEPMVDPRLFFRVNRNFIINFTAIRDCISYSTSRLKIVLDRQPESEEILVSRERVNEFKKWMDR